MWIGIFSKTSSFLKDWVQRLLLSFNNMGHCFIRENNGNSPRHNFINKEIPNVTKTPHYYVNCNDVKMCVKSWRLFLKCTSHCNAF